MTEVRERLSMTELKKNNGKFKQFKEVHKFFVA